MEKKKYESPAKSVCCYHVHYHDYSQCAIGSAAYKRNNAWRGF